LGTHPQQHTTHSHARQRSSSFVLVATSAIVIKRGAGMARESELFLKKILFAQTFLK
jgi:hypothetical protein